MTLGSGFANKTSRPNNNGVGGAEKAIEGSDGTTFDFCTERI
jgi:hypothetical protein